VTDYVVEITPAAEQEISDAVRWYAQRSPIAADTFRTIVFDALEVLSYSPLSWAKVSDRGVRRFVLPRYPYTIFFHVLGSTVRVLSVNHNRRMPKSLG
jgi:plasmid stabilization system protein ParE